jgi:hypothetical protein
MWAPLQQKIDSIHAQQDEAMEVLTINLKTRGWYCTFHSNANTLLDTKSNVDQRMTELSTTPSQYAWHRSEDHYRAQSTGRCTSHRQMRSNKGSVCWRPTWISKLSTSRRQWKQTITRMLKNTHWLYRRRYQTEDWDGHSSCVNYGCCSRRMEPWWKSLR